MLFVLSGLTGSGFNTETSRGKGTVERREDMDGWVCAGCELEGR